MLCTLCAIGYFILSVILITIGYYGYQELVGYLKIVHYRKQGIKSADYDFWITHIIKSWKNIKNNDFYKKSRTALLEGDSKQPFFVKNEGARCTLTLTSAEAVKEFYKIETSVSVKRSNFSIPFLGFFYENGSKVKEARTNFAKMFHYTNVIGLMPQLRGVIRRHVKKLRGRVAATS